MVTKLALSQREQLDRFEATLRGQGVSLGLVSASDVARLHDRHVLDSLRAAECLRGDEGSVADLGSGGGLPGIPAAIARPDLHFLLVESRRLRASFLERTVDELGLGNVQVAPVRIESLRGRFGACLARALAPPMRAWEMAASALGERGRLLYFAGSAWGAGAGASLREDGVECHVCSAADFRGYGPIVMMQRVLTAAEKEHPHEPS
jgi:16S rRNA (guanine527-N7)-methyltransferase